MAIINTCDVKRHSYCILIWIIRRKSRHEGTWARGHARHDGTQGTRHVDTQGIRARRARDLADSLCCHHKIFVKSSNLKATFSKDYLSEYLWKITGFLAVLVKLKKHILQKRKSRQLKYISLTSFWYLFCFVNFEHTSHLFLVSLLLTLNR